MIEKKAKNKFL